MDWFAPRVYHSIQHISCLKSITYVLIFKVRGIDYVLNVFENQYESKIMNRNFIFQIHRYCECTFLFLES